MDVHQIGVQTAIVFIVIAFLWLFLKTLKIIWKLTFIFLTFLALSFALPAIREWIFNLF